MDKHKRTIKLLELFKWTILVIGFAIAIIDIITHIFHFDVYALYFAGAGIIVMVISLIRAKQMKQQHEYDDWAWYVLHIFNIGIYSAGMVVIFLFDNMIVEAIVLLVIFIAIFYDMMLSILKMEVLDNKILHLLSMIKEIKKLEEENKQLNQAVKKQRGK